MFRHQDISALDDFFVSNETEKGVINAEPSVTLMFAEHSVPFNFADHFTKYSLSLSCASHASRAPVVLTKSFCGALCH